MNAVRRAAIRRIAAALVVIAPVAAYLLGVDYSGWSFPHWAQPLTVAFLCVPAAALLREGYALVTGRPGKYPFGRLGDWSED